MAEPTPSVRPFQLLESYRRAVPAVPAKPDLFESWHDLGSPAAATQLAASVARLALTLAKSSFIVEPTSVTLTSSVRNVVQAASTTREEQEHIVKAFGTALFQDYIKPLLPWVLDLVVDVLREQSVTDQIKEVIAVKLSPSKEAAPKPRDKKLDEAADRTLKRQLPLHLDHLCNLLASFMVDDVSRRDFATVCLGLFPSGIKEGPNYPTLEFVFKNYVPDILHTAVTSVKALLQKPEYAEKFWKVASISSISDPSKALFEVLSLIGQDPTESTRQAISYTLHAKLSDDRLTEQLAHLLQKPLYSIFFPTPTTMSESFKRHFCAILGGVKEFFHSFTAALKKTKSSPEASRDEYVISTMMQTALAKKILSGEGADVLETGLRRSLEDCLWMSLFPKPDKESIHVAKLATKIVTSLSHKISSTLLTPASVTRIILRFIAQPPMFANPYEKEELKHAPAPPPDKAFSRDLDTLFHDIIVEVLGVYSDNVAVKWIVDKILGLFLNVGDDVQKELSKNFSSSTCLMPVLILSQLLFHVERKDKTAPTSEELRACIVGLLEKHDASFDIDALLHEEEAETKQLLAAGERKFFTETQDLADLLKKLPFGTQWLVLEVIQTMYRFVKRKEFLKLFLAYILDGVKKVTIPLQ